MNSITTKEFVEMIFESAPFSQDFVEDDFEAAKELGIIDSQDILNADRYIERRHAAKILHNVLFKLIKEKDVDNIGRAGILKDLYNCKTCVNNIAQMFLKGIMDSKLSDGPDFKLFCPGDGLFKNEAKEIISRAFNSELRIVR